MQFRTKLGNTYSKIKIKRKQASLHLQYESGVVSCINLCEIKVALCSEVFIKSLVDKGDNVKREKCS